MRNKNLAWILSTLILLMAAASSSAADKITIALNWVPEPEFGGFYAAQLNGAYAKNNLDVSLTPGGAGTPTWQLVASGKADYAIASADEIYIARQQQADVVAIFTVYQTCPQGLMTHAARGLKAIDEVFTKGNGAKLAVEPGLAYTEFLKAKYGFDHVSLVAYDGGLGTFMNDPKFTQQCFVTSEPLAAKKQGGDPQVFLVADAGYNPYTTVVITRGDYAKTHADQVKAVVASLRGGWRAYLDDPKPANEAMGKLNPDMDAATFAAAAETQKPLIETAETNANGLGSMTKGRWETLGKQLVDLKVIPQAAPAEACFIGTGK